jgi:FlaA1/EpsC-like NDP-sugar epimerase
LFSNFSYESFAAWKNLLLAGRERVLWVIPENSCLEAYEILGFLRALRHEENTKAFLIFAEVPRNNQGVRAVARLAQELRTKYTTEMEQEFVWSAQDEQIMVPRLRNCREARQAFVRETSLDNAHGSLLKSDATYIITGGTGGTGRSLAAWMFEQGAASVVLLGRSGGSRPEVKELLEKYQLDPQVRLKAVKCDVGDRIDLEKALKHVEEDGMPPVRGVVHSALYLRVCRLQCV